MSRFDLVIIGGGAAGFAAAIRANQLGAKTALVNAGLPLGGTCVNVGCVPSKRLLRAAEILDLAQHHGFPGLKLSVTQLDVARLVTDELELVSQMREQKYQQVLQSLEHVSFVAGKASFISPNQIKVADQVMQADKYVIATGSTARVPEIAGLQTAGYLTHVEALKLKQVPDRLAVIGAGPVGLELGQLFARWGSQVTILQKSDQILPAGDQTLTNRLKQILQQQGINIITSAQIKQVRVEQGNKIVEFEHQGQKSQLAVAEILLAAGKRANTAGLNLSAAQVEVNDHAAVVVQPDLATSNPHIWAAGDVAALPLRLETTAGREGTLAAENALTGQHKSIDYQTVPYTVFTDPQLAAVGFSEEQQMSQTGVCACRTLDFSYLPKAVILNRTEGMIKMAVDPQTRRVVGVHILAPNACDLIAQAMVLVQNRATIEQITESLPVFPSLSEAIKLVALSFRQDISKLSCCV